ncbi:MAG: UDP-N-acetylglucosamine--N-acetylmuramyl-(pentapeptide) pyrophosphoryl-undecaprenol N-acetylglucosamine transferase [Synergistaceae bacterium]|nr:UDP-N-acetylglucosamine--N-acetylmuramyl-(pentapeptide) pyrophosphoryl-undecaprenol N-acetylglucosamine transferase [Synergistaceae bacterium]
MRICLVAGGTGGHIFPALSFGEWISSRGGDVAVSYVCGSRPLEREIYASRRIEPFCLPLSGSPFGVKGLRERTKRWRQTFSAFFSFRSFLRNSGADCCVLFGGYVSFVPLLAVKMGGIPAVIHEQNCAAGKVTRLASRMGLPVASGWSSCPPLAEGQFTVTGIPVRPLRRKNPREAWENIFKGEPFPEKKIIGILGGSLMSRRLIQLLSCIIGAKEFDRILFLTLGEYEEEMFASIPRERRSSFLPAGKQWDMTNFYSLLSGAVTRGGASTLYELMVGGIPSVVIPWKEAADNHQEKNARCFAERTGGEVWKEDDSPELLQGKILSILRKKDACGERFSEGDESEALWGLISSSIGREIN